MTELNEEQLKNVTGGVGKDNNIVGTPYNQACYDKCIAEKTNYLATPKISIEFQKQCIDKCKYDNVTTY